MVGSIRARRDCPLSATRIDPFGSRTASVGATSTRGGRVAARTATVPSGTRVRPILAARRQRPGAGKTSLARYRLRRHLRAGAATRRRPSVAVSATREGCDPRTARTAVQGRPATSVEGRAVSDTRGDFSGAAEPTAASSSAAKAPTRSPLRISAPLHRLCAGGSRHRASIERWLDTTGSQTGTTRSSSATCTITGSPRRSVYSVPDRAGSSTSDAAPAHTRRPSATGDGTPPAWMPRKTCCAAPATEASTSSRRMPQRFRSRTRASTPRSRPGLTPTSTTSLQQCARSPGSSDRTARSSTSAATRVSSGRMPCSASAEACPSSTRATARLGGTTMPSPASSTQKVSVRAWAHRTSHWVSSSRHSPRPGSGRALRGGRRGRLPVPRRPRGPPMSVAADLWSDLLEGEEVAYVGGEPARAAAIRPPSRRPPPQGRRRPRCPRHRAALHPPGRRLGRGAARRASRRRDGNGLRQDARLQPPRPRRPGAPAEDPRALPLPDEGARPGSDPQPHRAEAALDQARHLRRGHRVEPTVADPQVVEPDPDQPGHAPRRRPASPRPLGRRSPQPPLRGRRRGARVPRGLRVTRRERPAPPAPPRADLRRRPAVPARLGDDREPR